MEGRLHPVCWETGGEIENYRDHLYGRGLSASTVRNYELRLRQATRWARDNDAHLYTITPSQVSAMLSIWPATMQTRGQVRSALRYYWEMVGRTDPPVGAIPLPPAPRAVCRAVEPDAARALVKVSLGWRPEGLAVLIGLYLALRASEIAAFEWARFDTLRSWYTVLGKHEVTADLPVHPILRAELDATRRSGDWLFPGRFNGHVRPQTVWNWTQAVAREAGVGPIRVHDLRHTAIAEVHDRTGDLRAASVFARHAKIQTTERYTRTTAKRLTDAVLALDYLA